MVESTVATGYQQDGLLRCCLEFIDLLIKNPPPFPRASCPTCGAALVHRDGRWRWVGA